MELMADPYLHYASLRAEDPVHENSRGVWLLTRYDDVHSVLRDPRFGRKGFLELIAPQNGESEALGSPMQFQDPPGHTRLRNLVGKVFTHSLVDSLRPRIQRIVDNFLDIARNVGRMDLIAGLGLTLSVRVILELLGVPAADHGRFQQWSRDMTQSLDAAADSDAFAHGIAAQQAIAEYFRNLIAERRKCPRTDLVTGLIAAEHEGKVLHKSELLDICGLLFVAGHATTVNLIGNGVLSLLLHPSELRRLREEPGLLAQAVEELLRYESPVQRVGRVANTDVQIRGKLITKGAVVSAMLGAANRDPAQYAQPERLDITRRHNRHLAFGHGAHVCIGASLARLEGQIAIGTLVRRLPKLALVNDAPEWRNSTETRGLKGLQVTF
jgi:pimeloyl-[acyl-carrier protein] synthase